MHKKKKKQCILHKEHLHTQSCRRRLGFVFPWPAALPSVTARAAGVPLFGRLHIDGVSVLLAQGFVFLGVERLTLQVHIANRTDEAGVVPGVAQSLNELIARFNREVTAMTLSAEE